jgi:two-component system, chemotaxis family, protein-glutamate methylesterase/glutaminase
MAERSINNRYQLLLIGGSAGSLDVLIQLLPALRPTLDLAVVVVLHRKAGESVLIELLASRTVWTVKEAEEKQAIDNGFIYVAPADYHLLIEKNKTFSLDYSEKVHYSRPAIDVTFETAVEAYHQSIAAILLSGANADGAEGLRKIKSAGGLTIVQDPKEAAMHYMPQQAINLTQPDYVADTMHIIEIINRLISKLVLLTRLKNANFNNFETATCYSTNR